MAKKKKSNSMLFLIIMTICAIITAFMLLAPAVKSGDTTLSGSDITFGKTFASLGSYYSTELKFSFVALLAYLLPIVLSGITIALHYVNGKRQIIMGIITIAAFFISIVLFSSILQSVFIETDVLGTMSKLSLAKAEYTLAVGSIISIITGAIGAACGILYILKK